MVTLSARDLRIGYRDSKRQTTIVHEALNFELHSGELTCLMGSNGAGKSTLLRTLCAFLPPLAGQVELLARPLESYSEAERSKLIGVVLTEKGAAGGLTAYELASLGRHPHTGFFGELKSHDHKIISQSLEAVGVSHLADRYISQLSDGERQKVMIAKALAQQCPLIILDEPSAFLDVASRIDLMLLLRRLAQQEGKTILLSTHDLEMTLEMADRVLLQKKGAPLLSGAPEELILRGDMGNFLNREGVLFDDSIGRLTTPPTTRMLRLEGDEQLTFWVANALRRWGFNPVGDSSAAVVICHSINSFQFDDNHYSSLAELRARLLAAPQKTTRLEL